VNAHTAATRVDRADYPRHADGVGVFAGLISLLILKEPLTRWRAAAALIIVSGVILLRLA
jgi:hypothetical protein